MATRIARLLAILLLLAICLAGIRPGLRAAPHAPRQVTPPEFYGLMAGPARHRLVADWDAQVPNDPRQVERAYCITHYTIVPVAWGIAPTDGVSVVYIVTGVDSAQVVRAFPWAMAFGCAPDS